MCQSKAYFIFDIKSNVCYICYNLQNIWCRNVDDLLKPLHDLVMFFLSVTISKILTAKIFMTVTLTFRIAVVKLKNMPFASQYNYRFNGNSNLYHVCHRLQDNHV